MGFRIPSRTIIYIALFVLLICWSVGAYNRLVRLKNVISSTFDQVDAQLKRRYDLIPNLVDSAQHYLQHERLTLEAVVSARNEALAACDAVRSRPTNARAVTALSKAERTLDDRCGRLFDLADAYPELQADKTIQALREALTSIESQIAFTRKAYNDAALDYNNAKSQFPVLMLAKLFSFDSSATL